VLEGTYPYVSGGVSTWVHELLRSLPELRFALVHIGPERGKPTERRYAPPANVMALSDLYCREPLEPGHDEDALRRAAYAERRRHAERQRRSRVLNGFRRLHLEDEVDPEVLDDLASGDLSVGAFLHGRPSFDLTTELCERLAPHAALLDFFWHVRAMHLPLVRVLGAEPPPARVYHALCTGYAGLLAAAWSRKTGRPLLLTEHGIYTRERNMELSRAPWFRERRPGPGAARRGRVMNEATASGLRQMWVRFFRGLARCVYGRASCIVSLSEVSRRRQIADGAAPEKTLVVPNGVDLDALRGLLIRMPGLASPRRPLRVGFVGRVVAIKDVVTFIHACSLASRRVDLDVRLIGPIDEDAPYVRRCRRLVANLGLTRTVTFLGPQPIEQIYSAIDVLVLTSFSEGQPLVVLEAGAAGIPVVVSDVGACRELVEGRSATDRQIGPSGLVTRIAAPAETAEAIVRLALDPSLRRAMGAAGRRRVTTYYKHSACVQSYRTLYSGEPWQALAGASSA
jgi:glycosyltransferase involved in cell wall biosynthesis